MDADRRDEITDAALDRDVQAILGVAPSPEFVARLRTRIADEPSPSRPWFLAWSLVAAVIVAAIAIVAVLVSRDMRSGAPLEAPALDSRSAALSAWPTPDQKGRAPGAPDRPASRVVRSAAPQPLTTDELREPEILVDPREAAALRALIFGTRDGRIDLAPVLNASTPPVMELPPVVDIEIPVITIEPIAPGSGEEGVRQ